MEIEQTIRQLKVTEIDEMEWLRIREAPDNPEAEKQALQNLGLSMRSPLAVTQRPPAKPTDASLEELILSTPMGQLAPIRVIRYPRELNRFGKDYGLIFGYRRWKAAKKQGLPTLNAQIIHLTAEEYHDPKVRFWLRLMGLAENAARQPLSKHDYHRTIRWLKEQYEAIYPQISRQFHHLKRERNEKGHLKERKPDTPPGFARALSRIAKKSLRMTEKEIQIATLLNLELFNDRYSQPINQSAALILTQVSHEAQTEILDRLAKKRLPFTTKNIQAAVAAYQKAHKLRSPNGHEKPTNTAESAVLDSPAKSRQFGNNASQLIALRYMTLPDLSVVETMGKICIDLLSFTWSLDTISKALPPFMHMASAASMLVNFIREEKIRLEAGLQDTLQATK